MGLKPEYIVVHTAAFNGPNCDRDLIDGWHRQKGWDGIGYHYVIVNGKHDHFADGTVQEGRRLDTTGAHARGINHCSLGICCAGHGDLESFTPAQMRSLIPLISKLIDQFEPVTVERVIGHRELNELVARGVLSFEFRTSKSCPGAKVDMDFIRSEVRRHRSSPAPAVPVHIPTVDRAAFRSAIATLDAARPALPNAGDVIAELLAHPEVIELGRPDSGGGRPDSGAGGRPDGGGAGRPDS